MIRRMAVAALFVVAVGSVVVLAADKTKSAEKQRARLTIAEDAEPGFPAMTIPASWGDLVSVETNGVIGMGGGFTLTFKDSEGVARVVTTKGAVPTFWLVIERSEEPVQQ